MYRKLWETLVGPIPTDEYGRKFEIHHKDGDKTNNDISNLQCVSIQEHYDIHYSQGDYSACVLIGVRMKKSPEEISRLNSLSAKARINSGTHHFLIGGPRDDMKGDKNPMRNPEIARKQAELQTGRTISPLTRDRMKNAAMGRHREKCIECGKVVDVANLARWHGEKRRSKNELR